jgi:DNA polymerase III delta prime subunit
MGRKETPYHHKIAVELPNIANIPIAPRHVLHKFRIMKETCEAELVKLTIEELETMQKQKENMLKGFQSKIQHALKASEHHTEATRFWKLQTYKPTEHPPRKKLKPLGSRM